MSPEEEIRSEVGVEGEGVIDHLRYAARVGRGDIAWIFIERLCRQGILPVPFHSLVQSATVGCDVGEIYKESPGGIGYAVKGLHHLQRVCPEIGTETRTVHRIDQGEMLRFHIVWFFRLILIFPPAG